MDVLQKEALLRNVPAIMADLDVEYVEDHLLSKGVLNVDDIDRLRNKFSTRKERAWHLLQILPCRGPSAFDEFVESLREPYSWLAERLEKDKPVSTGAEATQIGSLEAHRFEDNLDMIPNEICETITAVSSILSSLGTSICSLGDCLVDLANVFNSLKAIQKPQSVIQTNLVNGSIRGRKTGHVMRCTGGGDFGAEAQDKVSKTVAHEVTETEISLKKLSVTERRQVDLKCYGILDNVERVRHKNDKILGIQENIDSEASKPSNIVSVVPNLISSSDLDLTLKGSYQTSEFANATSKGLVSDLASPSPETGLPVNSPDSGMYSEELSSHSLKSLCEVNDMDEADGRKVFIPPAQDRSDGNMNNYTTSYCERNPQPGKDFTSCCKELRYKEQNLLHSLKDYVNAVRSVAAQITDRGSGLARVG